MGDGDKGLNLCLLQEQINTNSFVSSVSSFVSSNHD